MRSLTRTTLNTFFFIGLCIYLPQQATCQDRTGFTGIGVQLATAPPYNYGSSIFSPSAMELAPDILVSTWLADQIALEPSVGLYAYTNVTYWRIGLTFVKHFGNERLLPFVLVRGKAYLTDFSGSGTTDYILALGVGGEYFVGDKFSVSAECQLNHSIAQKDRSLFIRYNITSTGVALSTRFYLN